VNSHITRALILFNHSSQQFVQNILGHKKLENTDVYTHLINFGSDDWQVAHARNLEEENKLIEAGFEYVRYSEKDEVAICRKRK